MVAAPIERPIERPIPASRGRILGETALLLVALAVIVLLRTAAMRAGVGNGIEIGLGFGVALAATVWLASRARPAGGRMARQTEVTGVTGATGVPGPLVATGTPRGRAAVAVAAGLLGGIALVALALVARATAPGPEFDRFGPNVPFVGWAVATTVVAVAEEALLRGALLDRVTVLGGPGVAILVAAVAFALMHVPAYGWSVVPLDFGVGLWLGGLRVLTRSLVAPAVAHVVADLATWWL